MLSAVGSRDDNPALFVSRICAENPARPPCLPPRSEMHAFALSRHITCRLPFRRLKNSSLHISMGEQLRTSTQEKQTCAICLQTIRKNAVWWHVTECRHYFHYDCWHTYHKHECDRREADHTRVRCPACRHPQISKAQFLAVMVPLMERALGGGQ